MLTLVKKNFLILALAAYTAGVFAPTALAQISSAKKSFQKQTVMLATLPVDQYQKFDILNFAVNAIGRKFAYVLREPQDKARVIFGKKRGKVYDAIKYLTFTPDGEDIVYAARKDDKEFMVIGGKEQKRFDAIYPTEGAGAAFKFTGNQVLYWGQNLPDNPNEISEGAIMDTGGIQYFSGIGKKIIKNARQPFASRDGGKLGYIEHSADGQEAVVVGRKKGASYRQISSTQFNDDGTVSYWGLGENFISVMVRNGQEIANDENVISDEREVNREIIYSMSPDGKTPIVRAWGKKRQFQNEKEKQEMVYSVTYNTTYHAERYGDLVMVGTELYHYDYGFSEEGHEVILSPDGEHFAYLIAKKDGGYAVVLDGKEIKSGATISNLFFDTEGGKLSYIQETILGESSNATYRKSVIADGEEQASTVTADPLEGLLNFAFTPDESVIVYTVYSIEDPFFKVIAGGKESERYHEIKSFQFTQDGRYVGFAALRENPDTHDPELWWVAMPVHHE